LHFMLLRAYYIPFLLLLLVAPQRFYPHKQRSYLVSTHSQECSAHSHEYSYMFLAMTHMFIADDGPAWHTLCKACLIIRPFANKIPLLHT